jgi:GUN4-like/TIR domain
MSVTVFFSYAHKDESLRDDLSEHLSLLKRDRVIQDWHDRQIPAGADWASEIDRNLNTADIILLLISASFLSSDYCWGNELKRAMERHEAREACVIPVILRPCDWQSSPFAKLQAFPKDAIPVTRWEDQDEAFLNVVQGVRLAAVQIAQRKLEQKSNPSVQTPPPQKPEEVMRDRPEVLQSEKGIDYKPLQDMLKAKQWKEADRETRRVMCAAMGRQEEGWLRVEDIKKFPCADLRTIDQLWVKYSDGQFGFSVQKKIWQECGSPTDYNKDWEKFGDRTGWRMNNDWISYSDVTFDTTSPQGHLPIEMGGVDSGGGCLLGSLLSRRDL